MGDPCCISSLKCTCRTSHQISVLLVPRARVLERRNLENMCSRKPIKKPLPRIFCTHPFINTTIKNRVPILVMHTSQIRKNTSTEMNHIGMVPIQKTHGYFWKPPLLLMMGSFHVIASTLVVEHFESFLTFRAQDCPKLPW